MLCIVPVAFISSFIVQGQRFQAKLLPFFGSAITNLEPIISFSDVPNSRFTCDKCQVKKENQKESVTKGFLYSQRLHRSMVNSYSSSVAGVFQEVEGSAECPITVMGDMSSQDSAIRIQVLCTWACIMEDNALHNWTVSNLKCYI